MKIDLHVHTRFSSDSLNSLKDVVGRCRELGVLPAITDHNNTEAHAHLRKMKFKFIPGEEVRTPEGDLIGLFLSEQIGKKTPLLETLDGIREQGGLVYLPHMYDRMRRGIAEAEVAKKADIIEVYNPRCIFEWQNEKALRFAHKYKKLVGAGSDAHFIREIGRAYVETAGDCNVGEPKGLLKALKNGKVVGRKTRIGLRGITTAVTIAKKVFRI